ncbi:MAG: serine/threonine-protein kinase, partial [Acidobacteriota bacterium]
MTDSSKDLGAERWRRIADIVEALVELEPAYRSSYLVVLARQDPAIRRDALRVLALFDADATAAGGDAADQIAPPPPAGLVGQSLGPYRVVERLGAGGMGEVYLAERDDEEYRRRVAIKIIRSGVEHPWTHRRFRRERQILASLVHPNIARMYDAGTTADGTPYLVMEWVDGEPITEYCRQRGLSIEERVALLRKVCAAVELAHQRFVLHRDLKPSNILVTPDGEPKLLDFGIARWFDPEVDDPTATLGPSGLTLAYASPEQIAGEPTDTASDVYSLGTVAYEVLTGRNPHRAAVGDAVTPWHRLRDGSAVVPRACVALQAATVDDHGWSAGAVDRAQRVLDGDLEKILAKALRVEPEHRYGTVERFDDDLRLFAEARPVSASGDALSYRVERFVRRHRLAVAATIVTAILLTALTTVSAFQAQVVADERDRVELALAEVTEERDRNQQISDFLIGTFDIVDRDSAVGRELTAKELIDDAVGRIEALDTDPEVQVRLLRASSEIYENLGQIDLAVEWATRAVETAESTLDPSHRSALAAMSEAGDLLALMGRRERARELHTKVYERSASLPPDDPLPLLSVVTLCYFETVQERFDEADVFCRRAESILDGGRPIEIELQMEALRRISLLANLRGDNERAERILLQAREQAYGVPVVSYAAVMADVEYARFLRHRDRAEEAVTVLERAVATVRRVRDNPPHGEAVVLRRLGTVLVDIGDAPYAVEVLE